MDFSALEPWILASLNAASEANLVNWTRAELYQYAEESLQAIGRALMLVVDRDDSTALVEDQALYPVPTGHIATVYCAADGVTLEPSSVSELEALDDDYEEAASSTPTRFIDNEMGLGYLRIYPPKNASGTLTVVFQQQPPDMPAPAEGEPCTVNMPAPVGDYLAIKALEAARRRQGDGQMLDAAQGFSNLGTVLEKAMQAYYGSGS